MWSDPRTLNRLAFGIAAVALVALAWCLMAWAGSRGYFALKQVRVTSTLSEVDPGLLESAIRTDLRGNFFSASPPRVRSTLRKLPWVRDVSVHRRWPWALDIAVDEHRAVGYWGESELLSDRGEVFRAASKAPMPRFDGPSGSSADVLARYREARVTLAAYGLDVKSLAMSPRGALTLTTGSDVQIEFGREQFQERLARFASLYGTWSPAFRQSLARVDLRYKAAVAVARNGNASPAGGAETQKGQS